MSRYIIDIPVFVYPLTKQEHRDLKEDRDSELYQSMLSKVEAEMWQAWYACGELRGAEPTGGKIHDEAMRRLKRDAGD